MSLKGVTFDIWETILVDGADEPKRSAQGMRSKSDERRHLFWSVLDDQAPLDKAISDAAFHSQEAAFRKVWHGMNVTWEVADRIDILLDGLNRNLPRNVREELIAKFEEMELRVPPDMIDGARDAIAELASRYDLCIISDTIYTPGRGLRDLLTHHGVAQYFKGFVFSDQVGRSKPDPDCFHGAATQLGLDFPEMLHVGDRDAKDVAGAQAVGMQAILFTAARDEDTTKTTQADAVVSKYADLIRVIDDIALR